MPSMLRSWALRIRNENRRHVIWHEKSPPGSHRMSQNIWEGVPAGFASAGWVWKVLSGVFVHLMIAVYGEIVFSSWQVCEQIMSNCKGVTTQFYSWQLQSDYGIKDKSLKDDIGDWSNGMIGVSKTFGGSSILSSPAMLHNYASPESWKILLFGLFSYLFVSIDEYYLLPGYLLLPIKPYSFNFLSYSSLHVLLYMLPMTRVRFPSVPRDKLQTRILWHFLRQSCWWLSLQLLLHRVRL